MAVRPVVLVFQDFAAVSIPVSLPSLNVLVVGPAYDINDYATEKSSISLTPDIGSLTTVPTGSASAGTTLSSSAIPGVRSGAQVDNSSVLLFLDAAYAEMVAASDMAITANSNVVTSATGNFISAGVKAGDRIVIKIALTPVTVAKVVQSVDSATQLTLTTNVTTDGTDVSGTSYTGAVLVATATVKYRVERAVNSTLVATASLVTAASNNISSGAVIKATIGSDKVITYAKLYVQYRALRTDLTADITRIDNSGQIVGLLGKIDERNPLAVGAFIASQNSNKSIQVFGVSGDNLNSGTDLLASHTFARDQISGRRDVYAVVPLTTDTTVIAMWKASVVSLADPSVAKFRVVIGSGVLPVTKQIFPQSGTSTFTTEADTGSTKKVLDNLATFVTSGVVVGDKVVVGSDRYPVASVLSENRVIVTTTGLTPLVDASTHGYDVERTLSRQGQADSLSATTASLKNSRVVMVWPDKCLLSGVSNAYTAVTNQQPGYYLSAAVGGMVAGLPPHQGFTFIGLAGIKQVINSNMYFTDDQIDQLGNAGWYVIIQDTASSIPYCIHELTTDTTTLESGELMVVKNFDYVSLTYRGALVGFLGVYNVIPETLDFLRSAFDSVTGQLKLQKYPHIGSPILSSTITSIDVLAGSKDRVEIFGSVTLPRPLNRIGLHLTA